MTRKIHVLGAGREVGRAAIAVEDSGEYLVLDYGVSFDDRDIPQLPFTIPPSKVAGLVITHSHLDHVGAAPLLYISANPRSFTTHITADISRVMLHDFLKLSSYYLPFEEAEVERLLSSFSRVGYGDQVELGSWTLTFRDAGHIPGSSMVLVEDRGKRILYTGDVNTLETRLVGPADVSGVDAEVLVIEATYGDLDHRDRRAVEEAFIGSVKEVLDEGGTVLVPAFSLSRSQEILSLLAERMPWARVVYDGMIRPITEIMLSHRRYIRMPELLEKANQNFSQVDGWSVRRRVWREPGVIVASAGMLKGGPALYYLKRLASNKKAAVFLVSYQGRNTPGRLLLEKGVFMENGPRVVARVEWFDFSAHAGRSGLLSIVKSLKSLERVVVIHSDPDVAESFAEAVRSELGVECTIPSIGDTVELD